MNASNNTDYWWIVRTVGCNGCCKSQSVHGVLENQVCERLEGGMKCHFPIFII